VSGEPKHVKKITITTTQFYLSIIHQILLILDEMIVDLSEFDAPIKVVRTIKM
jgi:hypothetical protein